jgi:outer membrane protein
MSWVNNINLMRFKKLIIAFVLLTSVFAGELFSQKVKIVNLEEAISIAKKNNSELKIAQMDKMKADEKVSEVYSENLVPTLSLSSMYTRALKKQIFSINFMGVTQTFAVGSDNTIQASVNVSEPIPVLGTPVFSGIRIAEMYSKLQEENVKGIEDKIEANVKKAFLNVLLLKDVIDVNEKSLTNSEDNLKVVESRYNAGVVTEFDYLRAKVKVETIKPNLEQAKNNLVLSKKVLKTSMGLKTDEEIDVTGKLAYDSTEVYGSVDAIIRKIAEQNVAIRQLKLNRGINEELVRVNRSSFLPKIYLFGQYVIQAQEDDGKPFSRYFYNNSVNVGIGLSWDLNFFKNSYVVEQSLIETKKNDEQILDVKDKLKTQAQSIIIRLEDAKNRIIAQRETVKMAERGLGLANTSFKSGVINQIDVLDAELTLSQVRLSYLQAIFDYLTAKADLEQLLEK